jgi:hypothetical protein
MRAKIMLNDGPVKQVSLFKYLGYCIDFNHFNGFKMELNNSHMCDTIKIALLDKGQRL